MKTHIISGLFIVSCHVASLLGKISVSDLSYITFMLLKMW